jgi:hypothetical protein
MAKNSNHYFETPNGIQGELTDDVISNRIAECNTVLGELSKSKVWQIVISDARRNMKNLDDNWQDILPDSPQFKEARTLKIALKHIFELPIKYSQELNMLQAELQKRQQPEEIIQKDADNE